MYLMRIGSFNIDSNRSFELDSADDMQALPTQIKWVRDGLLIIGLDTEMQIYSQWSSLQKSNNNNNTTNKSPDQASLNLFVQKAALNEVNTKKQQTQVSNLVIPKNHSVMDLNKLNKAASATTKPSSTADNVDASENTSESSRLKQLQSLTMSPKKRGDNAAKIFDEAEILEIVQDSGLFMQAK